MSALGERMREIRQNKKLSQKALGEKAGMSQQMIAQYESGQRQPKIETLKRIANALEVNLWEIIELDQLDENTQTEEIIKMMSELSTEGLEEMKNIIVDSLKPDKQSLIEMYDNMTDSARQKLITYAKDLWFNPHTHKELEE